MYEPHARDSPKNKQSKIFAHSFGAAPAEKPRAVSHDFFALNPDGALQAFFKRKPRQPLAFAISVHQA
jgi:hypothetical protein